MGLPEKVGAAFDTLTVDGYAERETVRALEQAAKAAGDLTSFGGPARCAWRGVRSDSLVAVDPRAAQQRLTEWRDYAWSASVAIAQLNAIAGVSLPSRRSIFEQLRPLAECSGSLPALFTLAAEAQGHIDELSSVLDLQFESGIRGLTQSIRVIELAAAVPYETLQFVHEGLDVRNALAALGRLDDAVRRRSELVDCLRGLIEGPPNVPDLDEGSIRAAGELLLEASLFSRFGVKWREARRLARGLLLPHASKNPRVQGEVLLALANRIALDRELDSDVDIQAVCGVHFREAMTEIPMLRSALFWRDRVRSAFAEPPDRRIREAVLRARPVDLADIRKYASGPLTQLKALAELFSNRGENHSVRLWTAIAYKVAPKILTEVLATRSSAADVAALADSAKSAVNMGDEWHSAAKTAMSALAIDPTSWFGASGGEQTAEQEASRIDEALGAPEALAPWLAYERAKAGARLHGAEHVLTALEEGAIAGASVPDAWRIAWLTDAAKRLRSVEPILLRLDGLRLAGLRSEYARLDASVMEMRRRAVAVGLMLREPPQGIHSPRTREMTELVLLRRCIAMAARHPAIRDVTARAGKALQALKPCFMMGPLSVAQYLAPGALNFDLVIMDEASQIRPEDAIGAVARGGQLVVVGDDRQLPPTSFFDRMGVEEEGAGGVDGDGGFAGQTDESVLALANGAFPGEQGMLQWHYRSRHPELIAFSNHQFYDNKLIVFPAPQESDQRVGLLREFVANGTAIDGVNDTEARAIAKAAADHIRLRPRK
jgi:hypothetical protein